MQTQVSTGTEIDWNGTHYEVLLTPHESGGKFGAIAADGRPGDGPPRHLHPKSDEVFVILQGRLRFWRAGEYFERSSGEIFHIPAGVEHSFVVVDHARWIFILTPGGLESFFPTVVAQGLMIPRDLAKIKAMAVQFDMEITGPPLAASGA